MKKLRKLTVIIMAIAVIMAFAPAALAEQLPDAENSFIGTDFEELPAGEDFIIGVGVKDVEDSEIAGLNTDIDEGDFEVSATGPGELEVALIHEIHIPGTYIIVAQYSEPAEDVAVTVEVKGTELTATGLNFTAPEEFYTDYSAEHSAVAEYQEGAVFGDYAEIELEFLTAEEEPLTEGEFVSFFVECDGPPTWIWAKEGTGSVFDIVEGELFHARALVGENGRVQLFTASEQPGQVELSFYKDHDGEAGKDFIDSAPVSFIDPERVIGAERVEFLVDDTAYYIDGEENEMDVEPFILDGRTFIPVRFLAEALGAEADWEPKDAAVETVFLEHEDILVTIEMEEYVLTVKDKDTGEEEQIAMDVTPIIEEGRTFLPFRWIAQSFGAEVDYSEDEGTGRVDKVWFTQKLEDPDDLEPIPEADPRIGESVVEGEILEIDKENRRVEIDIHYGPDTPDIEPVISIAEDALLRLYVDGHMEEELGMCDLEEGMITSYILEEDLEARAVIVHE